MDLVAGPLREISKDVLISMDVLDLFTGAACKTLHKSHKVSWYPWTSWISSQGSTQDVLIPLDLPDLFTGALYKTDLYGRSLHKISWYCWTSWISSHKRSARSLHKTFIKNFYTRSRDISGPLGKTSMGDLFTGTLYKMSSLHHLYQRSVCEIRTLLQELSTRSRHKTSIKDLFARPLNKTSWYL